MIENIQFPGNELGNIFNNSIKYVKKRKIRFFFLYIFIVLYLSIPSFQLPLLEYNSFRITSLMEQRAIEHYMLFYPQQSWAGLDDVNPNLIKSVVSMEDGSFFTHKGIDWLELNKSLRTNKRRGRSVRGGSTITMQLAKNLYLTTEKSLLRKGKEFLITLRMEKEVSKRGILRNYINAIEWGDGVFGIRKASSIYYDKDPAELTLNECARLAAVIPSPLKHQPNTNSRYVSRRASIILGRFNDVILYPDVK